MRELAADLRRICAVDGFLRGFCFGILRAPATPFGRGGKSNFFRSPLNQRGTKKTWIWQGEKIGGGLDESGAQNQRTRSCLTTCYQQRRETYAGRCVTNRGERRGDCSEIYLHSLPFGALILLGTALGCKIGGDGLVVTKIEALQKLAFLRLEDLAGPRRQGDVKRLSP